MRYLVHLVFTIQFQANLCLWGHVHNAEVTCPLYEGACVDSKPGEYGAPIHAVVGNGGQSLTYWKDLAPSWSKFRFSEFGYSTIKVDASDLVMNFYADAVPAPGRTDTPLYPWRARAIRVADGDVPVLGLHDVRGAPDHGHLGAYTGRHDRSVRTDNELRAAEYRERDRGCEGVSRKGGAG